MALDLVGFGIVLPILPLYAERFGARPGAVGLLVASFSVAQVVCSPLWGRVSDRIGRKPVLVLSLAGTAVGSLVTGLAGALWVLFLGRILDGASGASVSVAQAAVADVAAPEERARLMGLLGAAFGLGFVAGPALGALAALGGPHVPFFLAAAIAGANAVAAARRLPETHQRGDHRAAPPVPAHSAQSDHSCRANGREEEHGLGEPSVVPPQTHGLRDGLGPSVAAMISLAFVALVAFSAFEATFALFGERRLNLHLASTGAVFAGVGLVLVVVQGGLVRPVVARLGEPSTLRLALVLNAVGLVLLAGVHSWWLLVPALGALTAGQGLLTPTLTSLLAGRASPERRGRVLGLQQSAGGMARIVGPVAGGFAFQHLGAPSPYLGAAVLMAACAIVFTSAAGRRQTAPAASTAS